MNLLTELRSIAKALVAGATTAIGTAIPLSSGGLSLADWLLTAAAFLFGAFPTWAVPNIGAPKTLADGNWHHVQLVTSEKDSAALHLDGHQIVATLARYKNQRGQ